MMGFYNTATEENGPYIRIFVEIATEADPQHIEKINHEIAFALGRCGLPHSGHAEPLNAFRRNWNKEQKA